ncbi:MAG: flagellar biosynthesis protein FliQ [Rhodospirillales bacterium]
MNQTEVLDVGREAIIVLITVGAPIMSISLAIGLIIALFQALTQIQEMTLTFVPKILAIFVSLVIFLPFMLTTLSEFALRIADRIIAIN